MLRIAVLLSWVLANGGAPAAERSLYLRLGGKKRIQSATSAFVEKLRADSRFDSNAGLKAFKAWVPLKDVKRRLGEHVCRLSGGPCRDPGPILGDRKLDAKLSPLDWLYVIEDLNLALEEAKIGDPERKGLLEMLLQARQ